MKRNIFSVAALCALMTFSGCDAFLELEPLDKVSNDQLTDTEGGIKALLANIYTKMPMEDFNYRPNNGFNQHGYDGVNATTNLAFYTDEAVRSDAGLFGQEGFDYWPYSDIRQVNIFMQDVAAAKEKGTITEDEANRLTSEAYFIRAYMYYGMAKRLGGVPLIDHAQDDEFVPGDGSSVAVPRSTEKATWEFILKDCDEATKYLPDAVSGSDKFRATKWAAYALKSRVALHAASVAKYWNNAPLAGPAADQSLVGMTPADADAFYKECIDASDYLIKNSGKALYMPAPASAEEAATNFYQLFVQAEATSEYIFGKGYIDGTTNSNQGHSWTQWYVLPQANSFGALKYGRFNPTLDLVDLFENYDDNGQGASAPIVTRTDGNESYVVRGFSDNGQDLASIPFKKYDNLYEPFANKDARLLGSIIVPGSEYDGVNIHIQGGIIQQDGSYFAYANSPATGKDGKTYYGLGAEGSPSFSGFYNINDGEGANWTNTGFGVRKYMDEGATSGSDNASTNTFIDMRLAEVYLNYAEATVENGSGYGDQTLAAQYINDLRHRAGHTDNIPLTLDNVLKERRVELAFEGNKRYWDLIRRREFHTEFANNRMRHALVPMLDLREATPKYVFVRVNFFRDENGGGNTFQPNNYYKGIPGTDTNGLVQNPGR